MVENFVQSSLYKLMFYGQKNPPKNKQEKTCQKQHKTKNTEL